MPKTLIAVDTDKEPWNQETPLHNRWHPDIPPVATVQQGEKFRVECVDWTGGQVRDNDSSDDVKNVDLSQVHYLSGPIEVEGAKVGDLLKVELLNLGTLDSDEWGFTGTFAKENGGGMSFLIGREQEHRGLPESLQEYVCTTHATFHAWDRIPHRPLSKSDQGHLGPPWHLLHEPSHSRSEICRVDSSRADWHGS